MLIGRQAGYDLDAKLQNTSRFKKTAKENQNSFRNIAQYNCVQNSLCMPNKNKPLSFENNLFLSNPSLLIDELGYDYAPEQRDYLLGVFHDKDDINAFLEIATNNELNQDDVYSAFKYIEDEYGTDGVVNWLKDKVYKLTTGKSRIENKAEKLADNMCDIRTVRGDEFATETVLSLGANMMTNENTKANIMHFVTANGNDNNFLYTENNVLDVNNYMMNHPNDVNKFLANILDMESIRDAEGRLKYTGDTNIYLGKIMTENAWLSPTLKIAAHKQDMNNEYLVNITDNLLATPEMLEPINYSLSAKNADGTDKFTAKAVSSESNHLLGKSMTYCFDYTKNLMLLSKYNKLVCDDIVVIANNITSSPQIANIVINQIENNFVSSSEIAAFSTSCVQTLALKASHPISVQQNNNIISPNLAVLAQTYSTQCKNVDDNELDFVSNNKVLQGNERTDAEVCAEVPNNVYNRTDSTENVEEVKSECLILSESTNKSPEVPKDDSLETPLVVTKTINPKLKEKITTFYQKDKSVVFDEERDEQELKDRLKRKFGAFSDEIFESIQKNPMTLELIKQYEYNPAVIKAIVETPDLVEKIKLLNSAVSNRELNEMILLCDSNKSTELILKSLENGDAISAIKITQKAKVSNAEDAALKILNDRTMSNILKRKKLDELFGIEKSNKFIA